MLLCKKTHTLLHHPLKKTHTSYYSTSAIKTTTKKDFKLVVDHSRCKKTLVYRLVLFIEMIIQYQYTKIINKTNMK